MALEIRSGRIEFPIATGEQVASWTYFVERFPRNCWVGMSGYHVRYASGDHHVRTLQVDLRCSMGVGEFGPAVYVTARLLLRDRNSDDPFTGWVEYVLFLETDRRLPVLDASIFSAGVERWNV